jgi:phage-related protein
MGSSKEDLRAFPDEARREVGLYVLHCFQKKTQKTSQQDLDLARRRFR